MTFTPSFKDNQKFSFVEGKYYQQLLKEEEITHCAKQDQHNHILPVSAEKVEQYYDLTEKIYK